MVIDASTPPRSRFRFTDHWCEHGPVFAIVLVGRDDVEAFADIADTFVAPPSLTLPQLARFLGAFKSASDAKRQGWAGPLTSGLRKFNGASWEFSTRRAAGVFVLGPGEELVCT